MMREVPQPLRQLTVRGFDEPLAAELRELARREGISLNQAALRLLRRGAGLSSDGPRTDVVGRSLDHLIGTWSDEQAREVQGAAEDFEHLDEQMWQ